MARDPHFQLTTRDHAILQTMLEEHDGPADAWVRLLERKVRESTIYFSDDIPPGVVTLDTELTYLVDGVLCGPHVIVHGAAGTGAGTLALRTLRGLALVGLAERDALRIEKGAEADAAAGAMEVVQVHEVVSQPEAEARAAAHRAQNVVSFRPRRAGPGGDPDPDPDPGPGPGDDSGPSAA